MLSNIINYKNAVQYGNIPLPPVENNTTALPPGSTHIYAALSFPTNLCHSDLLIFHND